MRSKQRSNISHTYDNESNSDSIISGRSVLQGLIISINLFRHELFIEMSNMNNKCYLDFSWF